jgi:hypothetical protein
MSRLSTRLEVIGDEAVESLTRSPDQAISWNGGLATRWQAADGGMEANIGFLRQLYALEKMQSEGPTPAIQAELAQATRFYQNAVDGMLATGQFDVPGDGEFAGQMLSQYRALQADNARLIREWTTALSAYQNQLARYEHSADQLRLALVEVEAQGDATVEDQVHQLNAIIDYTRDSSWGLAAQPADRHLLRLLAGTHHCSSATPGRQAHAGHRRREEISMPASTSHATTRLAPWPAAWIASSRSCRK